MTPTSGERWLTASVQHRDRKGGERTRSVYDLLPPSRKDLPAKSAICAYWLWHTFPASVVSKGGLPARGPTFELSGAGVVLDFVLCAESRASKTSVWVQGLGLMRIAPALCSCDVGWSVRGCLYSTLFTICFGRVRILLRGRQASGGGEAHEAVGGVRTYTMISLGGREPSPLMQ